MRISAVVLTLLLQSLAFAQANTDANPAQMEPVVKVVRVRGDANELARLACNNSGIGCTPSQALRAVVVRGRPADVARTEETIQKLDGFNAGPSGGPTKNVETTVYVIAGSAEPIPGTQDVSGEALTPVVKQLRAIFPYNHYQLLSTMLLRSSEGSKAYASGLMKSVSTVPDYSQPALYKLQYERATLSNDSGASIKLYNFSFTANVPVVSGTLKSTSTGKPAPYSTTQFSLTNIGINSDVDLREGQKVVVGKVNVGDSNTCFFIVLSARLVP